MPADPTPSRAPAPEAARCEPDEMDEALNDGFAAVEHWQRAEARAEIASGDATAAMCEAIKRSSLSLREIAKRSKLSPAALSGVTRGYLDNLSSNATWRVLTAIKEEAARVG